MKRKRNGLVPIASALLRPARPRPGDPRILAPGVAPLHPLRSGETSLFQGQRRGPRPRLYGAAAGDLLVAPHQSRQPEQNTSPTSTDPTPALVMHRGRAENKLPYGNLPRLFLAWLCTEAVRTRSPEC